MAGIVAAGVAAGWSPVGRVSGEQIEEGGVTEKGDGKTRKPE